MNQTLLQIRAVFIYFEVGLITKWASFLYYKVRYLVQKKIGQAIFIFITNWGRYQKARQLLLQRETGITKRDNHYEVGQCKSHYCFYCMFGAKTETAKEHITILQSNCMKISRVLRKGQF